MEQEQDLFERIGLCDPQSKRGISLSPQLQLVFHSWWEARVKDHILHSQDDNNLPLGYGHLLMSSYPVNYMVKIPAQGWCSGGHSC